MRFHPLPDLFHVVIAHSPLPIVAQYHNTCHCPRYSLAYLNSTGSDSIPASPASGRGQAEKRAPDHIQQRVGN